MERQPGFRSVVRNAVFLMLAGVSTPLQAEDQTKIIVYRGKGYEGILNPFIQPEARLDGVAIGRCVKGEMITRAVAPGQHVVDTDSESPNQFAVDVAKGETVCVRCTISVGLVVPNWILTRDTPEKCSSVQQKFRPQ